MSHTPGPWQAEPNYRSTGWYVKQHGSGKAELAAVNQVLAGIDAKECEANARLMASAPELLAALHAMLDAAGDFLQDENGLKATAMAYAAIEKTQATNVAYSQAMEEMK